MTKPIVAGVIGWPVGHSRSPLLHRTWLARHRIAGHYVPLAVPPERLEQALRALPALGIAGVNVTVPHKRAVARLVDRLDDAARRTGSVNMVTVAPDGSLDGASTDGAGFLESLAEAVPAYRPGKAPAVVIGAGGAARAIVDALVASGAPVVRIANRTDDRARALAAETGPSAEFWPWRLRHVALATAGLVVNTTTQGMAGEPPLDLALDLLGAHAVVADIVYTPLDTPLLMAARRRGARAVDGLGMLLHQARPAFARWFGVEPAVDEALRRAVLDGAP